MIQIDHTGIKALMKLQSLVTEREGMIAENQSRLSQGHTPAYDESHFYDVQEKIDTLIEEFNE